MPIYVYKCDACGHEDEEFQHIQASPISACPVCTSDKYHRVPCRTHSDMIEFQRPIAMQSIGMAHDDEIAAFRERNPGVEISDDPDNPLFGVPIAHTRKEKLQILRNEGWTERK